MSEALKILPEVPSSITVNSNITEKAKSGPALQSGQQVAPTLHPPYAKLPPDQTAMMAPPNGRKATHITFLFQEATNTM